MTSWQRDIGSRLVTANALTAASAAGSTSAVAVNGTAIDRQSYNDLLLSGKVSIQYNLTSFSSADSVTFLANLQDSTSSTAWTDFLDRDDSTGVSLTVSGTTGSTVASGVFAFDADFSNANRYVRLQFSRQFGTTVADIAYAGQIIFGGADQPPAD